MRNMPFQVRKGVVGKLVPAGPFISNVFQDKRHKEPTFSIAIHRHLLNQAHLNHSPSIETDTNLFQQLPSLHNTSSIHQHHASPTKLVRLRRH